MLQSRYIPKTSSFTAKVLYFTTLFTLFLIPYEIFDFSYYFYSHLLSLPCSHPSFYWFVMSWILDFQKGGIEFFKTNQMVKIEHIHRTAEVGRPLWKSSVNLSRVSAVPLSPLLMMMLNSTEPRISPWDAPLVTGVQLNFVALITILWADQLRQFSIHLSS